MSQSPIDFFLIRFMMKNPLLQLTASAAVRLLQASAEWDPCPLPSRPRHPPPSEPLPIAPTHPHLDTYPQIPNSLPFPTDNMHGNLRFYYVQQPCLDYVLFLGFSEVILFSLSDISSAPDALHWRTEEAHPPHFPSQSRLLKTCIPFSSHVNF